MFMVKHAFERVVDPFFIN